jgi:hypothetical protein
MVFWLGMPAWLSLICLFVLLTVTWVTLEVCPAPARIAASEIAAPTMLANRV